MEEFSKNGLINAVTNETCMCLVPEKKTDSLKIRDFRPISLMKRLCKVVAKVLAACLREVMGSMISHSHGAFSERKTNF